MLTHVLTARTHFAMVVRNSSTARDAGALSRCVIGGVGQKTMMRSQQFSSIFCLGMTPHITPVRRCSIPVPRLRIAATLAIEIATVIKQSYK